MHDLYPWSQPGAAEHDVLLAAKAPYLNVPFFMARAALYFARVDRARRDPEPHLARATTAPATGATCAACGRSPGRGSRCAGSPMTFAAVDWAMSLEPHWFSTIYGVMFIVGQGLATLAFTIVVSAWLFAPRALRRAGSRRTTSTTSASCCSPS